MLRGPQNAKLKLTSAHGRVEADLERKSILARLPTW